MLKKIQLIFFWGTVSLLFLIASLGIAWGICAYYDFGYAWWYELLNIQSFIVEFGADNIYKKGFEQTDFSEHKRLFHEIVIAIHQGGNGLADIQYQTAQGVPIDTLLIQTEVKHLSDVAHVVTYFLWTSLVCLILGFILIGIAVKNYRSTQHSTIIQTSYKTFPGIGKVILSGFCLVLCLIIGVFWIGPKAVFYWLHKITFGPKAEWFFYYEESLMVTLMKAPYLFGAISVLLTVVTVILYFLLMLGLKRCFFTHPKAP